MSGSAADARARRFGQGWPVLLLVWAAGAVYVGGFVDRGWVPHDEGMLGQNAERVLRGELPHRDFDESYTGGLTRLHALAFRLFGIRLLSLRVVLFGFFLIFVPVLYSIALRLVPPWPAGLVTLLGVVWSFPNYFASMPSWYVLFFAALGTYALLRELETGRKSWLFLAGICGGLSLLAIVVGLYFVAAALAFLAYREQMEASLLPENGSGRPLFFVLQAACVLAFLAALVLLLRSRVGPAEVVHFAVLPMAVMAVLLTDGWRNRRRGRFRSRFAALATRVLPFGAGLLVPLAFWLAPYVRSAALGDFYRGVFVLPFRQIAAASMRFPPLAAAGAVVPYALLLAFTLLRPRYRGVVVLIALAMTLALVLVLSSSEEVYRGIWHSARSLDVVAVLLGCWMLLRRVNGEPIRAQRRQETFLILSMTAMLGLIQFPYAAPVYFCYVAPLVALALCAVAREGNLAPHGVVAVFYLAFGLLRLNPGYIWQMGVRPVRYGPLEKLDLPRAGIRVPVSDRRIYTTLVESIERRTSGDFLYAAPDCPEVIFLSGRRNPSRVVFGYLRVPESPEVLVRLLEARDVRAVVINEQPSYSPPLGPALEAALALRYPEADSFGPFVLRWRP